MKNRFLKILPLIILILSEIFLYFQMMFEKPELTIKYKIVYLILCILSNLAVVFIYKIMKKGKLKIENIFLTITILFGGLYLIFIPALLGTDELPHFLRPYQISVGDVFVKNPEKNETLIPEFLANFVGESTMSKRYTKDYMFKSVDYTKTTNLWNGNVTSIRYSPIPYIPQIIGFLGARVLKLSPLFTIYFVRLVNFISWVILGYFAIKLLPSKKIFALILYTSPAVLSIVSTCSYDTFAWGLFFFIIAYVLNLIRTKRKLNWKDYLLITLVSLGISGYKIFYVLYLLVLFLIPIECFNGNKRRKALSLSLIFALSLFIDFSWYAATSISSTIGSTLVKDQMLFVLTHPFNYLLIIINTYIDNVIYYITNFVAGSEMCYGLVRINQLFILLYMFVLIVSYFDGADKNDISIYGKWLIIIVTTLIFIFVSTTLYLDWTSQRIGIGATKIVGVQSRYFLPFIIPIISILPTTKKSIKGMNNLIKLSVILNSIMLIDCIKSLLIAIYPTV